MLGVKYVKFLRKNVNLRYKQFQFYETILQSLIKKDFLTYIL